MWSTRKHKFRQKWPSLPVIRDYAYPSLTIRFWSVRHRPAREHQPTTNDQEIDAWLLSAQCKTIITAFIQPVDVLEMSRLYIVTVSW